MGFSIEGWDSAGTQVLFEDGLTTRLRYTATHILAPNQVYNWPLPGFVPGPNWAWQVLGINYSSYTATPYNGGITIHNTLSGNQRFFASAFQI